VNLSDVEPQAQGLRLSQVVGGAIAAGPPAPEASTPAALWQGLVQGAGNIATGLGRLGARGITGSPEAVKDIDRYAVTRQQDYQRTPEVRQHPIASAVGETIGEMGATAPLAAARGATTGAAALWGALTGATGGAIGAASTARPEQFARDIATGAGTGMAVGGPIGAAGAVLRPPVLERPAATPPPVAPPAVPPVGTSPRMAPVQMPSGPPRVTQSPSLTPEQVPPGAAPIAPVAAPRPAPPTPPETWKDAARMLVQRGVRLSPGQALNMSERERSMQTYPILQGLVRGRVGRSVDDFNRATVAQSLEGIGGIVPRSVKAGYPLMEFATKRFNEAYEPLLPHISLNREGVTRVIQSNPEVTMMMSEMAEDDARRLSTIIQNRILGRFDENGMMSGKVFKEVERDISARADGFAGGRDDELARALRRTLGTLRDEVTAQNPRYGAELQKINRAFSLFAEARAAAVRGDKGVFTPKQLRDTIRGNSTSESRFSQGLEPLQAFADAGMEVIQPGVLNRAIEPTRSGARMLGDLTAGGALIVPYLTLQGAHNLPAWTPSPSGLAPVAGVEAGKRVPRRDPRQPVF